MYHVATCTSKILEEGGFAKTNIQLDFNPKPISKLESNAKLTLKPCEITVQPLMTKQKNGSYFYEYSPNKSSEMLEVVWMTSK